MAIMKKPLHRTHQSSPNRTDFRKTGFSDLIDRDANINEKDRVTIVGTNPIVFPLLRIARENALASEGSEVIFIIWSAGQLLS